MILPLVLVALSGCSILKSDVEPKPTTKKVEIGSQLDAKSALVFRYTNLGADTQFQNYQITIYLNGTQGTADFDLCESVENAQGSCPSHISVWETQLGKRTLWIDTDVSVPTTIRQLGGETTLDNAQYRTRTATTWGKKEVISRETRTVEGNVNYIKDVSVTTYSL